ncbi:hypothetical protein SLA2020_337430 [Shorea laevis]
MALASYCPKESLFSSSFLPQNPSLVRIKGNRNYLLFNKPRKLSLSIACSSIKIVRSPALDKHVVKQNKIRFVQKLKTLLLSKPKNYIPLHILSKCRSYLSLPKHRSILTMIYRYPSIFELFRIPTPPTPLNATKSGYQLCVRLTPAAASLATQELSLMSAKSSILATKLQKLLMLSSHHRLLLSKLVHIAPDLGLPPNFRSRLCNDHPDRFKIVDTSYGRALELIEWNSDLAVPLKSPEVNRGLIVDRPLKFKQLRLRKGLNLKRRHHDFLIKFRELPDVCPYNSHMEDFAKTSIEAEKRACAVVREVLGMMVERRTLVDHLTHFRKEFGLPNKLRAMIVRHPELFYVSLKGLRDSLLLVEAFDDKGVLLEKDDAVVIKNQLMQLAAEGKKMRREMRKARINSEVVSEDDDYNGEDSDYDDGFENLFESEDSDLDYDFGNENDEINELLIKEENEEFWTANDSLVNIAEEAKWKEPW